MDLKQDLDLALKLAEIAAEVSLARFRSNNLKIETKPDRSHVTDADKAVESALREHLKSIGNDDEFFGEEFGTSGNSNRRWIVDPIDSTANFLRGLPVWGNLIALAIDGKAVVGVIGAPALNRKWWAARGLGAFTLEMGAIRQLEVSKVAKLADSSISFQSISQWDEVGKAEMLLELSRKVWRDRAYGDFWAYTHLVEGTLDGVFEFGTKEWDLAALVPIIEEAGGTITDYQGNSSTTNLSVVASNGKLHREFLEILHQLDSSTI